MKSFEANIKKVVPYTPGEQPQNKVIKLNTNENPYPPSKEVEKVLHNFDVDVLRLYPDPTIKELVDTIADYHGVDPEQVFAGVGSDEVLALSFLTFFHGKKPILFPKVTYSFYKVWADLYDIPYKCTELDENFVIEKEDFYEDNGGIIIPNPNAPTSLYMELSEIEDILKHNQDVVVIIDEAYIDYAKESALKLLDRYENLLVIRTFSKSRSMAGMRIGYGIGSKVLIKHLNNTKHSFNSYTLNAVSIQCGKASIEDDAYFKEMIARVIETREQVKMELKSLGFTVLDSSTNFLFVKHKEANAKKLFEALKAKDIYVRHWMDEPVSDYLRISIGTNEEMEKLIKFMKEYLN